MRFYNYMPPIFCEKYKQSDPDAECFCDECKEEKIAKKELKALNKII